LPISRTQVNLGKKAALYDGAACRLLEVQNGREGTLDAFRLDTEVITLLNFRTIILYR
jgi:hypothetical protein